MLSDHSDRLLSCYVLPDGRQPGSFPELQDHLTEALSKHSLHPASFLGLSDKRASGAEVAAEMLLSEGILGRPITSPKWPLTFPIDWAADPYRDENWRARLNGWRLLEALIVIEHATDNDRYWRTVFAVIGDWLAFHVGRDGSSQNAMAWKKRLIGLRARILVYLTWRLSLRRERLDESYLRTLLVLLVEHFKRLAMPEFQSFSNHGIAQVCALKACSRLLPGLLPDRHIGEIAHRNLQRLFKRQFSSEGIHLEHSPHYHRFALREFDPGYRNALFDDEPKILQTLRLAHKHAHWMYHPNGSVVRIGDGASGLADVTDTKSVSASFVAPAQPPPVQTATFVRTGYCVVRSRPEAPSAQTFNLFFSGAFHSGEHKHSDDMCFEWFDRGRLLLVDTGGHVSRRSAMRDYSLSTRAHNTLEIDGCDLSRSKKDAYGSALKRVWNDPLGVMIHGRASHEHFEGGPAIPAVHRDRLMVYQPNRWLLVVDAVRCTAARQMTQWHHLAPDLHLGEGGEVADSGGARVLTVVSACSEVATLTRARGQMSPRLLGWTIVADGNPAPTTAFGLSATMSTGVLASLFLIGQEAGDIAACGPAGVALTVGDLKADIQLEDEVAIRMIS